MGSIISAIFNFLLTFNFIVWGLVALVIFGLNTWTYAIGGLVIFYYLITTSIAITVGILIMSMVKAGNGFDLTSEVPENIGVAPNLLDIIMSLFPSNIFESFAQGNLIHIVIFGLMIGITTLTLPKPKKEKLESTIIPIKIATKINWISSFK